MHTICIFVDLRKAFDTVNRAIVLKQLSCMLWCRGMPLQWFTSFLTDRRQRVRIRSNVSAQSYSCSPLTISYLRSSSSSSAYEIVNIYVPQGSILGPFLFLLHINDLPGVSNLLTVILFADDTTLSASHVSHHELVDEINAELVLVADWTCANRLSINVDKTNVMLFTDIDADRNYQIIFKDEVIEYVNSCKFLRVLIDENIKFDKFVNNSCCKVSKSIGIMYKFRYIVPERVLLTLYYCLVYPYLVYSLRVLPALILRNWVHFKQIYV